MQTEAFCLAAKPVCLNLSAESPFKDKGMWYQLNKYRYLQERAFARRHPASVSVFRGRTILFYVYLFSFKSRIRNLASGLHLSFSLFIFPSSSICSHMAGAHGGTRPQGCTTVPRRLPVRLRTGGTSDFN